MESRSPRLSLDELQLLRWLLGGALLLLSIATVFYLDIGSEAMAAVVAAAVLFALVRPGSPARVPVIAHRLAFPAIAAFFAADLWYSGQLLPAIVRLDLLLILYRGISHRARRDDMQIVVLGLFLIVVAGVLTVSLIFAAQILLFTACALGLMMVVTIAGAAEGGQAPKLAPKGVVPPWAENVSWRRLLGRLRDVSDWRLVASGGALFLGVVAVSALLFMAIPRFQLENSLFLERFVTKKAMTGFNDSIKFGDITDITLDDSIAFEVDLSDRTQAPGIPYWRMVVLDQYQNGGFKLSPFLRTSFDRGGTAANIYPRQGGGVGSLAWTFYVEAGVSRYLPLLGNFWVMRFREAQNYQYATELGIVSLRDEPATMTAYRVEGMAPISTERPDRQFAARWAARGPVGRGYLQVEIPPLSDKDKAALARLVAEVGPPGRDGATGFAERAMALLRRTHGYSLSPHIPSGPGDPLVKWMDSRESGHCELFAGAMVLLCRSAGIPARVVTGFKGGTWNGYSGNYTVRNSDAHAWNEIWDEKKAVWLTEDPLASNALGSDQQKGDGALARLMDRSWSARLSSLRVFWYRRIVNFDQQAQVETLKSIKSGTELSSRWLRTQTLNAARWVKYWALAPWNTARLFKLTAVLAGIAAASWMFVTGRWRLASVGRRKGLDPVRREAGRWLVRLEGPENLVADLQRLRYGPAPTWPRPTDVFRRARRAASSSPRRRRGASRSIS
jgi:transglutaminase-like putative cysteine protease